MQIRIGFIVVTLVSLTLDLSSVGSGFSYAGSGFSRTLNAQQPQTQQGGGLGQGQGRGGGRGEFPAQQRPPGDPAVVARGKAVYDINCSSCHGADLRGGELGGPNLLRSQVVLSDQSGELILPIVRGSREDRGMPAINLNDDDAKAAAEYIHSVGATARRQGAPPVSLAPPTVLVGDATAGQAYFAAKCSGCHSPTGDLQGIAAKTVDAKTLQNLWISGGVATGRGGGRQGAGAMTNPAVPTVIVTVSPTEKVEGRLVRIDDFLVMLVQGDGTFRSFRRDGDRPAVEIRDPLQAHRALLLVLSDKDMHDVTAYLATLK